MNPAGKLPFNSEFQAKALGLMMNHYDVVAELDVKPEYFEDPVCSEICQNLLELKREFGLPITTSMLEEKLTRDGEDERLLKYSKRVSVMRKTVNEAEKKYLTKELTRFVKYQAVRSGLSSSVDRLRVGDLEGVEKIMQRAFQVGKSNTSLGLRYFSGVGSRIGKRRQQKDGIRTLITELDACLDNYGLNYEELGVVLSPPNRGKSFFLIHVAKTAIIQKKKVVFYTLEMSEDKVAERLDASFSGIEIKELRASPVKALEKIQQLGKRYGEALIIKRYPARKCDVNIITAHLDRLAAEDFYPSMLIVDYGDLMAPTVSSGGDRYYELGNVYEELKGVAQERELVVWTASQAGRGSFSKELITIEEISESFQKAMIADVIVSLCQNSEEKKLEKLRLFLAKNKQEMSNMVIPIYTNFRKGSFYRKVT